MLQKISINYFIRLDACQGKISKLIATGTLING